MKPATTLPPSIALDTARQSYQQHAGDAANAVKDIRTILQNNNRGLGPTEISAVDKGLRDLASAQSAAKTDLQSIHDAGGADPGEIAHDAHYLSALNSLAVSSANQFSLHDDPATGALLDAANSANSGLADVANQNNSDSDVYQQGAIDDANSLSAPAQISNNGSNNGSNNSGASADTHGTLSNS